MQNTNRKHVTEDINKVVARFENEFERAEVRREDNAMSLIARQESLTQIESSDESLSRLDFGAYRDETDRYLFPLYSGAPDGTVISRKRFTGASVSQHVGVIHVTEEKLREHGMENDTREAIERWVDEEIENHNLYSMGQVYEIIVWDKDGTETDSCGGFIGEFDYETYLQETTTLNLLTDRR